MSENRFMFLKGKIVKVKDAKINALSPTAQFGANVFEGIRCYWNSKENKLYGFRLDRHFRRLHNSINTFGIKNKFTDGDFLNAIVDVVKANNYKEDIAIRQTVFVDGYGSWYSTEPVEMFVAPIPKGRTLPKGKLGFDICVSSYRRISESSMSPKVKVGANYINSRMAQLEAMRNGYDTCVLLNDNGKVSEGPGSCLFMIRDDVLITPPLSASILESITRESIIEIAKEELKMEVVVRDIDRTELYICDELFLCGSAMEIVPILTVDGHNLSGKTKYTELMLNKYLEIARNNNEKYKTWLTEIK